MSSGKPDRQSKVGCRRIDIHGEDGMDITQLFEGWKQYFAKNPGSVELFDPVFEAAQALCGEAAESGYRLITNQPETNDHLNALGEQFIKALVTFEKDGPILPKLSNHIQNDLGTALSTSRQLVHYWSRGPKP